jgi:fermentation-respiration switch protein FrsA (DUF1100 family)
LSILAAPSGAEARKAADAIVAEGVQQKLVDQNEFEGLARDATTAWFRGFIAYDPAPTLTQVNVPVLAIYGSLDTAVPAVENSLIAIDALKGNPSSTVVVLPGKNHLMQTAKTGGAGEYNDIDETMSPTALNLIVEWASGLTNQN